MYALCHQSCGGPEVCEGIASHEMSEGDFDKWFKQESHKFKLLCPQKLVSLDVGAYTQKPRFILQVFVVTTGMWLNS